MSTEETNPFVPGARVAISDGWDNWHEGFVEKVHKTGRFTLKDGKGQQWRPVSYRDSYWRAFKTGVVGWDRSSLRIWDDAADAEIKEIFAAQARRNRHVELRKRFDRVGADDLTDAMLDQISDALPPVKATP
jgi:hypothetical protein